MTASTTTCTYSKTRRAQSMGLGKILPQSTVRIVRSVRHRFYNKRG